MERRGSPIVRGAPINLFWHRRYHRDAGNRWLRGLLFAMFAE